MAALGITFAGGLLSDNTYFLKKITMLPGGNAFYKSTILEKILFKKIQSTWFFPVSALVDFFVHYCDSMLKSILALNDMAHLSLTAFLRIAQNH